MPPWWVGGVLMPAVQVVGAIVDVVKRRSPEDKEARRREREQFAEEFAAKQAAKRPRKDNGSR